MTGEYSKLQPHQEISLSRNIVFETVEIFMEVLIENFYLNSIMTSEKRFHLQFATF